MGRPPRTEADPRLLTPTELEIMQAVWAQDGAVGGAVGGTVAAIAAALPQERAYTTVATLLAILESKGFLESTREGNRLIYRAATPRPAYEQRALRDMLERLFGGSPSALLRALVQAETLPDGERARLQAMLDDARPEAPRRTEEG